MSTLTLALPLVRPTVATEFDYAMSSDGRTVSGHGTAPLALLPQAELLVLAVPARALSWHRAALPPVSSSRLRAALDGLLEERLLDDATLMAYALVPDRLADGQTLVAVYDKAWMRAVLEFFEQARRPASRVVPEFAPEPPQPDGVWRVHVTGPAYDAALVLRESEGVTCLPLATAPAVIAARMAQAEQLDIRAEPLVAELAEQVLGRAVAVQTKAQGLVEASQCRWDLTQFELSLTGHGRIARRWREQASALWRAPSLRATRWGALALLLVNLVGLNGWAWRLDAAAQDKQAQVKSLLTRTFPKVRTIVDAPLQMQRELTVLRQASGGLGGDDMESMVSALGSGLPAASHASALDFAPGQLTARGIDLTDAQFDALRSKLVAAGYSVQREADRLVLRMAERT